MVVPIDKIRTTLFKGIYSLLNADKPTYTDRDSATKTFTILSAFPEDDTVYPCIVINPMDISISPVTIGGEAKEYKAEISLEFYAKARDGKNAIDSAQDDVAFNLIENSISDTTAVDTGTGGQEINLTVA